MALTTEARAAATLLGVEVINGYVIIAERPATGIGSARRRIILGAQRTLHGFDYVTAEAAPVTERPTSWDWGHYFNTHLAGRNVDNFAVAVADFQER